MVKVIMGLKGSGKTKQLVDMINAAAGTENGNVVAIERNPNLTFDIHYKIRLVDCESYGVKGYTALKGFISGLYASNYDITHIFIDGLLKIVGDYGPETEEFFGWLEQFSEKNSIKFTVSVSADEALASENVRKYF